MLLLIIVVIVGLLILLPPLFLLLLFSGLFRGPLVLPVRVILLLGPRGVTLIFPIFVLVVRVASVLSIFCVGRGIGARLLLGRP